MKKNLLYFVWLLCPLAVMAQEEEEEMIPYMIVEEKPMFSACVGKPQEEQLKCFWGELNKHVKKHYYFPTDAAEACAQGRVNVSFCIDKKGKVKVLGVRGAYKSLEEAAKHIIEQLPTLIPGKHRGENRVVTFAYPISFKLEETMPCDEK